MTLPETVYDEHCQWLRRLRVGGGWLYILQYTPTDEGSVAVAMTFVPDPGSSSGAVHLDADDLFELTRRNLR